MDNKQLQECLDQIELDDSNELTRKPLAPSTEKFLDSVWKRWVRYT